MHENDNFFLNLSHLKLTSIPEIHPSVVKLDLRRNQIEIMDLPYLCQLKELDFSDNKIKMISSMDNMPNLKILDLSYNLISEINFPKMHLEELYLICNDILFLENLNMPNLKILDLAVNEIDKIENLNKCVELRELYLGSNKISEVPDLSFLVNLRILDLQNNDLREVDCRNLPQGLETLLLSENINLTNLKNIDYLQNLTLLGIRKTEIRYEHDTMEIKNE